MTRQVMNHSGYRAVQAKGDPTWAIPTIEASANIAGDDIAIRLKGKRGGNRYDQTILGMPLDEAESFAHGLLWLVAQLRGNKLDTIAQSVVCEQCEEHHVGHRFAPDTDRFRARADAPPAAPEEPRADASEVPA